MQSCSRAVVQSCRSEAEILDRKVGTVVQSCSRAAHLQALQSGSFSASRRTGPVGGRKVGRQDGGVETGKPEVIGYHPEIF